MKRLALLLTLPLSVLLPSVQGEKPAPAESPKVQISGTAGLVDPSKLAQLIPETMKGFQGEPVAAKFMINDAKTTVSYAQRTYLSDVPNVSTLGSITIRDYGTHKAVLAELVEGWERSKEESLNGYRRVITVEGSPAFDETNRVSSSNTLTIVVKERFLVEIDVDNATPEEFAPWRTSVDLKKLAAME